MWSMQQFEFVIPGLRLGVINSIRLGLALMLRLSVNVTVALRLGLGLPSAFRPTMFLPSLMHSPCALLSRLHYRRWLNKISN